MSKVCVICIKGPTVGYNVSHAHNKSRRKFNVNLQKKTFWVDSLNKSITLRVSAKGLRTIDKKGIDAVIRDLVSQGRKF